METEYLFFTETLLSKKGVLCAAYMYLFAARFQRQVGVNRAVEVIDIIDNCHHPDYKY